MLSASEPTQLRALFNCKQVEHHAADSVVFWEGDAASHVFEVVSGMLRIVKNLSGGRRVVIGFLNPGDISGAPFKGLHQSNAEAVMPTQLRRCDRLHFDREVVRLPHLRQLLLSAQSEEVAAAHSQMVLLARKTAEERVCSFLVVLARGIMPGEGVHGPVVELAMPRLDIADYLGLTTETLSRIMGKLTKLGVISLVGRRAIVIRALGQLEAQSGEGYEGQSLARASA